MRVRKWRHRLAPGAVVDGPYWRSATGACIAAALAVAGIPAPSQAVAAQMHVRATSASGKAIVVDARAVLKAPDDLIWQTLTDYERLPEFIPGMKRSRVIERTATGAIVEQEGEASFLLLKYPIRVVVESIELPPAVISVRMLHGSLRQLDGRYRIEHGASDRERLLTWSGIVEPDSLFPAFVTSVLMRRTIESQFAGLVEEIERRDRARQKKGLASAGR